MKVKIALLVSVAALVIPAGASAGTVIILNPTPAHASGFSDGNG